MSEKYSITLTMSSQTITVTLRSLTESNEILVIDIDSEYNVLDFIMHLKSHKENYGSYSIKLPKTDLFLLVM